MSPTADLTVADTPVDSPVDTQLPVQAHHPFLTMDEEAGIKKPEGFCRLKLVKTIFCSVPMFMIIGASLVIIGYFIKDRMQGIVLYGDERPGYSSLYMKSNPELGLVDDNGGNDHFTYKKSYQNTALRNDFLLQECQGPELKRSFPDLDYALMGYNVLKAFPLAVGHDPGFSLPIFTADYSDSGQTADCRYSVPRGVIVIPDVSCVVSFTSQIIQTRYEYSKSLSTSAEVSGGGWGASFSASTGYKRASSTISTGEYAYILSTASCQYYYSQILANRPPSLHPAFVDWVHRLDAAADNLFTEFPQPTIAENAEDVYIEFFDTYGTHFVTQATFGARYTQESKMESTKLETMSESGVNVAAAASYSGLFSVGGGFTLDTDQKEAASNFQKNTETKTITVGASPPSNGDALTWASTVQEYPVPVNYKLASMEDLFSKSYMSNLGVNYDKIAKNIQLLKGKYCQFLMDKGEIDSCTELQPGLELEGTRLVAANNYRSITAGQERCIEECYAEVKCVATTKCYGFQCTDSYMIKNNICYLFEEKDVGDISSGGHVGAKEGAGYVSVLILPKISSNFYLESTALQGIPRGRPAGEKKPASYQECWAQCYQDEQCVAFSFCACPDRATTCLLYAKRSITGMIVEAGTSTFFISHLQPPPNTTGSPGRR